MNVHNTHPSPEYDIIIVDKSTPKDLQQSLLIRVRRLLTDLEICYPLFSEWLEKVFRELETTDTRKIILCITNDIFNVVGVAIIKNTEEERKICTLRVSEQYQRQGIGSNLLQRAIHELKTPLPLITVSEIYLEDFKPFLYKHGFKLKDKVKSLYKKGQYEYFFNEKFKHNA